jgi:hypothetical protein
VLEDGLGRRRREVTRIAAPPGAKHDVIGS